MHILETTLISRQLESFTGKNIHYVSLVSSEEGVNIIISSDPLERFIWMILLSRHRGVECLGEDFMIVASYRMVFLRFSYDRIGINIVSSQKEVMLCLDLFFCQNCIFVNEKSITVWVQSFMKTISKFFSGVSLYKTIRSWISCSKVEKFFSVRKKKKCLLQNLPIFHSVATDNFSILLLSGLLLS